MVLNLQNYHFTKSFGKIQYCHKALQPDFNLKIEKKPAKPAGDSKNEKKGDAKKDGKDKKKGGDKKADKPAKKEETKVVPVDKMKNWINNLPELKLNFYDFKTELVNSKDKAATLMDLMTNRWEEKGLGFWLL